MKIQKQAEAYAYRLATQIVGLEYHSPDFGQTEPANQNHQWNLADHTPIDYNWESEHDRGNPKAALGELKGLQEQLSAMMEQCKGTEAEPKVQEQLDKIQQAQKRLSDMPSPQHSAPTGKWYHVSPFEMQPGERIHPPGESSSSKAHPGAYNTNSSNRRNYVWMTTNPHDAKAWGYNSGQYLYEVHPGDTPQQWGVNEGHGWVAPYATVRRRVR